MEAQAHNETTEKSRCRLLDLPKELRLEIYSHALTFATPIRITHQGRVDRSHISQRGLRLAPELLRTCSRVYGEAIDVLYSCNTFRGVVHRRIAYRDCRFPRPRPRKWLDKWFDSIGTSNVARLNYLRIRKAYERPCEVETCFVDIEIAVSLRNAAWNDLTVRRWTARDCEGWRARLLPHPVFKRLLRDVKAARDEGRLGVHDIVALYDCAMRIRPKLPIGDGVETVTLFAMGDDEPAVLPCAVEI